jgi:hypothetical protein
MELLLKWGAGGTSMWDTVTRSDGDTVSKDLTGEDRCWPCTVVNAAVGLLVALVPLAVALLKGEPGVVRAAAGWAIVVTGSTIYRLVDRGYLPLAAPVAKLTGLHERIGPGSDAEAGREEE